MTWLVGHWNSFFFSFNVSLSASFIKTTQPIHTWHSQLQLPNAREESRLHLVQVDSHHGAIADQWLLRCQIQHTGAERCGHPCPWLHTEIKPHILCQSSKLAMCKLMMYKLTYPLCLQRYSLAFQLCMQFSEAKDLSALAALVICVTLIL